MKDNDNYYNNQSILREGAIYFDSDQQITDIINEDSYFSFKEKFTGVNKVKIEKEFNWDIINRKYETFLINLIKNRCQKIAQP